MVEGGRVPEKIKRHTPVAPSTQEAETGESLSWTPALGYAELKANLNGTRRPCLKKDRKKICLNQPNI